MKILVTGTDGYLGSLLVPMLLEQGHEVTGVDVGFYRSGWLYESGADHVRTITRDIRTLEARDLAGHDAVVHMAELSNDPAGDLAPGITREINHLGSVRLAELAKRAGIRRFIYMSSCSVYGAVDGDREVDETTPPNPQTAYALCKTLCERDIIALAGPKFSPVCFRNATAFGASPRQRFDLVVNNLCGLAWTSVGGDTLEIEVNLMPGKGKFELTGQLGDVMQESAKAGISYIRSVSDDYELDPEYFQQHDIHIHIPEGAVPKDGPSAGITMLTAMASVFTQRKVKAKVAMTGEISLIGKVMPVGGIKEKILAAKRAGIKEIILCHKNRRDIEEIDAHYLKGIQFHYVTQVDEVLAIALTATQVDRPLKFNLTPETTPSV